MTDDDIIDELIQAVQNIYLKSAMPNTKEPEIIREHETIAKKRLALKTQINRLKECIDYAELELEHYKKKISKFIAWLDVMHTKEWNASCDDRIGDGSPQTLKMVIDKLNFFNFRDRSRK